MAAIELSGVRKEFADVTAVRDLDLTVEEGEVYGFLGPNGAGKSTTINILLDFVRPSAGKARVLGRDAHRESLAVRQRTGVLPEGFGVYDRLSGRQHVEFAIDSKDAADDPDELLSRVGLAADGARKAGGYSKGMRQRLALAMALVGEPELLILDEPSSGLDPTGAKDMREIVREEVDRGATVFFSSHVLGQVEAVCDRVGILRDGRLVAEDSVEGLREAVGDDETLVITVGEGAEGVGEGGVAGATAAIRDLEGVSAVELDGDTLTVSCRGDAKTAVLSTLEEQGIDVDDFTTREASLEDLFLAYTEGKAGDSGGSPQAAETPDEREGSA